MSLRERLYDHLEMVAVLGPAVPDLVARLSEAVTSHTKNAPEADVLRRRQDAQGAWGPAVSPEEVPDELVHTHAPGLAPAELALRTLGRSAGDLPVAVAVSGGMIAFSFPHDLFDGVSAWAHITPILQLAAGMQDLPAGKPVLSNPLYATLRQAKLLDYRALQAARDVRRRAERELTLPAQSPVPLSVTAAGRRAGWTQLVLSGDDVAWIDRTVSTDQVVSEHAKHRSVRSMKLVEIVLAGLKAGTPPEVDYTYRLPVDLRRYAPRGVRVDGPFATAYPLGTLRTGDNSAGALTLRLGKVIASKAPLAAMVGDLSGLIKQRVRHPFTQRQLETHRSHFDVTISTMPARLPPGFWAPGGDHVNGVVQFSPRQPIAPYIQIADIEDSVAVSVWDETQRIDHREFARGVTDAVAARTQPSKQVGGRG